MFALDARIAIRLNASGGIIQATFDLPSVKQELEFIDVVATEPKQSFKS